MGNANRQAPANPRRFAAHAPECLPGGLARQCYQTVQFALRVTWPSAASAATPTSANEPGKTRLVGDVAFDEAVNVADFITPVPWGFGPMTIACLLRNTVIAACLARGIKRPTGL